MKAMELSEREQIMFDLFKSKMIFKDKKKKIITVDELSDALKKAKEKPRGGSRALTVSVRYLGFKIAQRGYSIHRVSDLGRGNKAQYRMERMTRGG
jgi:hypothetical protein